MHSVCSGGNLAIAYSEYLKVSLVVRSKQECHAIAGKVYSATEYVHASWFNLPHFTHFTSLVITCPTPNTTPHHLV